MAKMIEARLTDEFIGPGKIPGIIHSKFRTVLNILFKMPSGANRLITIITPGTDGIPDSITVPEDYFERIALLPAGCKLFCENLVIYFDNVSETLKGDILCIRQSALNIKKTAEADQIHLNLLRYLEALDTYSLKVRRDNGFSVLGAERKNEVSWDMRHFAGAWLKHDIAGMERILLKNAGLGIGLTPSCDDAFLGIIALYSGAKLFASIHEGWSYKSLERWSRLPSVGCLPPFSRLLSNRTTDISLKYLCCSQEGRFSDAVIKLVEAVFSGVGKDLEACIESVSLVGESSGMDLLFGTEAACRELLSTN